MGLAAIAGPILAGWLVSADLLGTGWRMIFLLNVPLGLAGLIGALRFMPESRSPARIKLDPVGVALISAASLCLIYPLVQGRELGWPLRTFGLMAAGIALLAVFAMVERRSGESALIAPSLLRNRAYKSGLVVGIVFSPALPGCSWSSRCSCSSALASRPSTPA
jgi:MFS family permease